MKLLLLFAIIGNCSGYRILGINPLPKQSHFLMLDQLFKGLARKGHQIDFISTHPPDNQYPNYTHIMTLPYSTNPIFSSYQKLQNSLHKINIMAWMGYLRCESIGNRKFLQLARNPPKDPPYDIIIMQVLNFPCYMILGHLWKIPIVLVSTGNIYPWMYDMIGNPENPSFYSHNIIPIKDGRNFWSRFYNTHAFYWAKFNYLYYTRDQDQLLKKYFGPDIPSIRELERTASLILVNTYFPINGIKPMTSGLIEVGGLHIQNDGPELSDTLKTWLDESKRGVIYFSFGSIYSLDTWPYDTIKVIFDSFEKIAPTRVLMKISKPENLKMKIPDNVYTMPWMPQEKILQHTNVKAFVTHGGLLGTQESIYHGIPMLCMPFAFDQWTNSDNYVKKNIAIKIDLESITSHEFDRALHEILHNSTYRENIKKYSSIFRDRPQNALDTATFWIEFVARNGKDSLRSPAMDLSWWQISLLDVYAVTIIVLLVFFYATMLIIKTILLLVFSKKVKNILKDKKHN